MKRLFQVILAIAMVVSYLPLAEAGDSATLGVTVTFDINNPPVWRIIPQDTAVIAGHMVTVPVKAEDPDGDPISYDCVWYLNGVPQFVAGNAILPEGARFIVPEEPVSSDDGFVYIPYPSTPILEWVVPSDINLDDIHEFEFIASDGETEISGMCRIIIEPLTISIELVDHLGQPVTSWNIEGVKLGSKVSNYVDYSKAQYLHNVRNAGNYPVDVTINYGPIATGDSTMLIQPGSAQGLNTFITEVDNRVLQPGEAMKISDRLVPDNQEPLPLTYGAPTELSESAEGHETVYELKAYPTITMIL